MFKLYAENILLSKIKVLKNYRQLKLAANVRT